MLEGFEGGALALLTVLRGCWGRMGESSSHVGGVLQVGPVLSSVLQTPGIESREHRSRRRRKDLRACSVRACTVAQ